MITACLISTTMNWDGQDPNDLMALERDDPDASVENFDSMDGPSEEDAYRQGVFSSESRGCLTDQLKCQPYRGV